MYEKMLSTSYVRMQDLNKEKIFLVGSIFYLPTVLNECHSDPELIEDACKQIVEYLSGVVEAVDSEYKLMEAIHDYLCYLPINEEEFNEFDNSPEYELFKEIFDMIERTYPMRASEYYWYLRAYKSYADTKRISPSYKIISKKPRVSKNDYEILLDTIPKV